jgi:hypothetical protein
MPAAQKTAILAQVGHFYFGVMGQYYVGANNKALYRTDIHQSQPPGVTSALPDARRVTLDCTRSATMRISSIALWLSFAVFAVVATAAADPRTTATQQQTSQGLPASTAVAANEPAQSKPEQSADEEPPFDGRHPGDTALSKDSNGKWQIRSFPTLLTLYVSDRDQPGKSNCNSGCDSAWPPLFVSKDEATEKVGDWTVIVRDDGRTQWAYKGQPVYVRFHDIPLDAHDVSEGWRKLEP